MLILQRKAGESLLIGEDISISVVSVGGGRVRLAISAPRDIPILREELVAAAAVNMDSAQEESAPAALLAMLGPGNNMNTSSQHA
jgi:carbon storage regulator